MGSQEKIFLFPPLDYQEVNMLNIWKRKESHITLVQMNETIIISSTLNTGDSQVSYI